jgi:NAD(P)-dependent dehydrogenase (short-subunit alcohol dehydrogenase family)
VLRRRVALVTGGGRGIGSAAARGLATAGAAVAAGDVREAAAADWTAALEEATRSGRFFACTTHFIVAGRKP